MEITEATKTFPIEDWEFVEEAGEGMGDDPVDEAPLSAEELMRLARELLGEAWTSARVPGT